MAVKLVDIAADLEIGRQRTYIEMFAESTPLMSVIPVETHENGRADYKRRVSLGTPGRRSFNEGYTESTGRSENVSFYTKLLGSDVDVDRAMVRRAGANGENVRMREEAAMATAIAHQLDNDILNGDESSDPEEFNGLVKLIAGTAQEIDESGPGQLSTFEQAIMTCQGGTHWLMSRATILKLTASTRATGVSGYLVQTRDELGVISYSFGGLPILVSDPVGHNNPGLTGYTETSNTTSVYLLNLSGDSNSVRLIQQGPMDVIDLGEVQDKPVLRTRIDWDVGIAVPNPRGIVRIKGITNAAMVA